jgi:hypothetical protein
MEGNMSEYVGILMFLSGILLGICIIFNGIFGLVKNNPIYIPKRIDLAIGIYFYFLFIVYVILKTRGGVGSEERILLFIFGLTTISVIYYSLLNSRELVKRSYQVYGISHELLDLLKSALATDNINFSEINQIIKLSDDIGSISIAINNASGIAQIGIDGKKNAHILDQIIGTMKEIYKKNYNKKIESLPLIIFVLMGLSLFIISLGGIFFIY